MLADGIELVLQQRLLGQDGVFNDQLEQAGDVETVQVVRLGGGDQRIQQIALALFVADRTVRVQFGLADFDRQFTAFRQQGQQFQIQCADALAQHQ